MEDNISVFLLDGMFLCPVFKIEDQTIMEQLKAPKREEAGSSWVVFLAGSGYVLGLLLTPLMDYFEIPISSLVNIMLLALALILAALMYFSISHKRKKKLYDVVELETLQKEKLWIRPSSNKQVFKLLVAYLGFLGFNVFLFMGYIETRNIMVLIIASGFAFSLLLTNHITVEEGHTTVKFKD